MTKAFVVVVGAGPAGAIAAREILRAGLGPVALLDRARFPRVKPCAGGLSAAARRQLSQLGLLAPVRALAYPISGALIQAPSGRQVLLEGGEGSLVLDRTRLDHLLVQAAVREGADLHEDTRAEAILPQPRGWLRVETASGRSFQARFVVLATGAVAPLAHRALPEARLTTMTGWYEGVDFVPNRLEMYFDPDLSPHYGWLFPEAPDRVNIGLCLDERNRGETPIRELFQRFLDRHFSKRMTGARQVRPPRAFPIAASPTVPDPSVPPGTLVVGEAARLANRATGEGISQALASGRMAARTLRQAIAESWSPTEASLQHLARLRRRMGPELLVADKATGVLPTALNATATLGQVKALRPLLRRLAAALQ